MNKDEIVRTVTFFNTKFKIYGGSERVYEQANILADELLRYECHKMWEKVRMLHDNLPNKEPVFTTSPINDLDKQLLI